MSVYINNEKISFEQLIDFNKSHGTLVLENKELNKNELYTVIIYDISAPNRENPIYSPYLHYLKVNVLGSELEKFKVSQGDVNYEPPNPPEGDYHIYIIDIYSQLYYINNINIEKRNNFDLDEFIKTNNLTIVFRFAFRVRVPKVRSDPKLNGNLRRIEKKESELSHSSKFCKCVASVAAKQNDECLENPSKYMRRTINGKTCYNPIAICKSSLEVKYGKCGKDFDYNNLSDDEIIGLAKLLKINIPEPYDRNILINKLKEMEYYF
ncbi:MAG: YbhB/YbcL family Raf kinase inhibitor-like protein [Candidatus Micrarchaeaceae archaeon]